jgi:hypothetical protein
MSKMTLEEKVGQMNQYNGFGMLLDLHQLAEQQNKNTKTSKKD